MGARFASLDSVRGFAVMGILLMNVVSFAMPSASYMNPVAYGSPGQIDMISWAFMAVLIDGKMRALFSFMFGASMLLVYERAQASAGNGRSVHSRRMIWLIAFGLIHYFFIWYGDILALYGSCGIVAVSLLHKDDFALRTSVKWTLGLSFGIMAALSLAMSAFSYVATQPGASADLKSSYQSFQETVQPTAAENEKEIALHRGTYAGLVHDRLVENGFAPIMTFIMFGLETIGLMAIGMMLLRNGFLTGAWETSRYSSFMRRMYLWGIPPLIMIYGWMWYSGFDAAWVIGSTLAWTVPFRIFVALGHAAVMMLIIKRFSSSAFIKRVEATGKCAFTNYLGTSVIMTTLFYGHGFGLFAKLSLWQAYCVAPFVWLMMLSWSKPWMDRFQYGPLEWLWRSLAKGALQPLKRSG